MASSTELPPRGALAQLLHPERRLLARLRAVLRLDASVYDEIQGDLAAIPQAFALVIGTSILTGAGQGFPGAFLGIVITIAVWLVATFLIWAVGALWLRPDVDYSRLLRCTGFAYCWFALLIGYGLPFVGWVFGPSAVALCFTSLVLATRSVLRVSTQRALVACAIALGTPLALLWWASTAV